jgi:hypothetical protein
MGDETYSYTYKIASARSHNQNKHIYANQGIPRGTVYMDII